MSSYRRENYHAWTWGIAALIALALLWLWITGRGPGVDCCNASAPVATAPAPTPAPVTTPAPTPTPAPVMAKPMATLYFDIGKTTAPTDTAGLMADVVTYLKKNTASKAVISGYNDPSGDAVKNAELSKNRAKAAREALKAAGIDETRVEMRKPADTNLGGDPKQARRVEITVEP